MFMVMNRFLVNPTYAKQVETYTVILDADTAA
jgi:hypothetical protein